MKYGYISIGLRIINIFRYTNVERINVYFGSTADYLWLACIKYNFWIRKKLIFPINRRFQFSFGFALLLICEINRIRLNTISFPQTVCRLVQIFIYTSVVYDFIMKVDTVDIIASKAVVVVVVVFASIFLFASKMK